MRLFVAINFSPEIKKTLLDAMREIRKRAQSASITRPENLHLTLAFIGETDDIAGARAAIDSCTCPAFNLTVGGLGHFGDLYWSGIAENPNLSALAKKLQAALLERGFDIDHRPFKPHITLARRVQAVAPLHIAVPETGMTVRRISLMKSERINGMLTYTEVYGRNLD